MPGGRPSIVPCPSGWTPVGLPSLPSPRDEGLAAFPAVAAAGLLSKGLKSKKKGKERERTKRQEEAKRQEETKREEERKRESGPLGGGSAVAGAGGFVVGLLFGLVIGGRR